MKNIMGARRQSDFGLSVLRSLCLGCILVLLLHAVSCKTARLSSSPMAEKEEKDSTRNETESEGTKDVAMPRPVPPEGPDLREMQLAVLEMDSPDRIAKGLPVSFVSNEKIRVALPNMFFGIFGIKNVADVVDSSRRYLMAVVTSAATLSFGDFINLAGRGNVDLSQHMPVFTARVPVKGDGEEFLMRLGGIASESVSTAWGGHSFKIGSKHVWVHIKGSWAVLADREEHVGPAWKLFDQHKFKIGEGGVRLDVFVERFHGLMAAMKSLIKIAQSSAVKAADPKDMRIMNVLAMALNVWSETGLVAMELEVAENEGVELTLTGGGLRGQMGSWLQGLSSPDNTLFGVMPAGTPVVSASSVMKTERYFWTDLACNLWKMMLGGLDGLSLEKREQLDAGMRTMLDGWAESLGTSRLIGLYFEDNNTPAFLLVSSLDNPERFMKTVAMAAEFTTREFIPLQKMMSDERGDKKLRKKAGSKRGPGFKISRSTRRIRGARMQQVAIRPAGGLQKGRKRVSSREFFFPKGFVVSALTHDGFGVIHIGESLKSLPRILDRLKNRKKAASKQTAAEKWLKAVLNKTHAWDMASAAGVDGASFTRRLAGFFSKRAPVVLKMLKPAAGESGEIGESEREGKETNEGKAGRRKKLTLGFSYESLKKMSGYLQSLHSLTTGKGKASLQYPAFQYRGGRSGNDYVMRFKIPASFLKKMFLSLEASDASKPGG